MRKFQDSVKALEADIEHANALVGVPAGLRRVGHPDADGVQRRSAFPRAVDRLQARRRARPPQGHALQGVRGRLVGGAARLGEGGQHQGVLRRHIPFAAAAAERDHRAGREEAEEALPEEVQGQGRGALGGGHGEGARVRHLPRGQPQGRAARLRPHALHAVLRGLEREIQILSLLPRLPGGGEAGQPVDVHRRQRRCGYGYPDQGEHQAALHVHKQAAAYNPTCS